MATPSISSTHSCSWGKAGTWLTQLHGGLHLPAGPVEERPVSQLELEGPQRLEGLIGPRPTGVDGLDGGPCPLHQFGRCFHRRDHDRINRQITQTGTERHPQTPQCQRREGRGKKGAGFPH